MKQSPLSANDVVAQRLGLPSGSALEPIETPLVFSGFQAAALRQFSSQLQSYGFVAAQGGTAAPRADDSQLKPGDMAGMVLVQGDASINSACTVTAVQADRVFSVRPPVSESRRRAIAHGAQPGSHHAFVVLASTKIVNVGGSIGTITGDHITAVTGKFGAPPAMIPLELTLASAGAEKKLHFELVDHPRLTPILVALTTFSGLTQNSLYGEGTTLHLSGEIRFKITLRCRLKILLRPATCLSRRRPAHRADHAKYFLAAVHQQFRSHRRRTDFAAGGKRAGPPFLHHRERVAGKGRSGARRNSARARAGASLSRRCANGRNDRTRSRSGCARHHAARAGQRCGHAQSRLARLCRRRRSGSRASINSSRCSIANAATIACTSAFSLPRPPCCGTTRNCPTCRSRKSISSRAPRTRQRADSCANRSRASLPSRWTARCPESFR